MNAKRSTLLVYNTVDRLAHGDLFHTVTTGEVLEDLAAYPDDWPVVGVGTTAWSRRNGELIPDGTAGAPQFLWADPAGEPVGQILNLCWQRPSDDGPPLVTPQVDDDDQQAQFPFLAVAVCNPADAITQDVTDLDSFHDWFPGEMASRGIELAGVQARGRLGRVKTTDAYNVPTTGLDLSGGYRGDEFFRSCQFAGDEWVLNGVFAASPSLQPFVSVAGLPLHLHGYRVHERDGGHIVFAEVQAVSVTVWPLADLKLQIRDVARAMRGADAG